MNFQGACVVKLSGKGKIEDSRATKQIVALLSAPLEKYNDIVTVLTLSNYPRVLDYLDNETSKIMAVVIIKNIMKNKTFISTADRVYSQILPFNIFLKFSFCDEGIMFGYTSSTCYQVESLFGLIRGLINDMEGTAHDEVWLHLTTQNALINKHSNTSIPSDVMSMTMLIYSYFKHHYLGDYFSACDC